MSKELTVYVDSQRIGDVTEETLTMVPREFWGKQLKKIFSSPAPFVDKVLALQMDAQSRGHSSSLFEPRHSSQFTIPEEDTFFGMKYTVLGRSDGASLGDVCFGVCRYNGSWIYASDIKSETPTKFANESVNSDLWQAAWADGEPAPSPSEAIAVLTEGSENFEFVAKGVKNIDAYIARQTEIQGSTRYSTLASVAISEIFDLKQNLHHYDKITFVLTGTFRSTNPLIPALSTGIGFKRGGEVIIKLGTEAEPCFILGCGGDSGRDGGVGLELTDGGVRYAILKGNSASLVAGGGGGGAIFKCSSKEGGQELTIVGGGGASGGRSVSKTLDPTRKVTDFAYFSKKILHKGFPANPKIRTGLIKEIKNVNGVSTVSIFGDFHELHNTDRVFISDVSNGEPSVTKYYIKSVGPRDFELYLDKGLQSPENGISFTVESRKILGQSPLAVGYGLDNFFKLVLDAPLAGYTEEDQVLAKIENNTRAPLNKTLMIEATSVDTEWLVPSVTGNASDYDSQGIGDIYLPSSGRWSFLGSEGALNPFTHSMLGYENIVVDADGGWFGESGQFTEVKKIYNVSVGSASTIRQLGGDPGSAIASTTTFTSGFGLHNLSDLQAQDWVVGNAHTIAQPLMQEAEKTLFFTEDYNAESVEEHNVTHEIISEASSRLTTHLGGSASTFDGASITITGSGILSNFTQQ